MKSEYFEDDGVNGAYYPPDYREGETCGQISLCGDDGSEIWLSTDQAGNMLAMLERIMKHADATEGILSRD